MRWWWLVVGAVVVWLMPTTAQAAWLFQPDVDDDQAWVRAETYPMISSASVRQTIQPDYPYHALLTPNDPQWSLQWNFTAIQAAAAWDFDQTEPLYGGDPGVVVAVLDTGLAYENFQSFVASHEISTDRIWTNRAESVDGVDNDGNGYVDDLHGWDFMNNDAHPNDDHGHGTHIAGTIAGQTNNDTAVAGLAWQSTILPLKVLDADGNGSTSTIASAINYAVQAGADVINLSLGGNSDDVILHQAIQSAVSRGVVVIAAAGNDGAAALNYPARYSEVIAVGATQFDSTRAAYSNYGPGLDLMAPGGNVNLDQNSDGQPDGIAQETCTSPSCSAMGIYLYTGTSQAAAHVAGAVALLLACGASSGTVATTLSAAAVDLGPVGVDHEYGAGLINLEAALSTAGCSTLLQVAQGDIQARPSPTTTRLIRQRDPAPYTKPVFSWTGESGAVFQVRWGKVGGIATMTTQTANSFRPTLASQGLYQLSVNVIDALGGASEAKTFFYRFRRPTLAIGQASRTSTVILADTSGRTVRTLAARLGDVQPEISAGLTGSQLPHLAISGRATGTAVSLMDTKGVPLKIWRPFGTTLVGGSDTAFIRRNGQETLVAATGAERGATVRWMTLSGRRVRSVKVFPKHDRGVTVASADLTGDGTDETIAAKNSGSLLAAYSTDGTKLWQTKPLGSAWRGSWTLTAIDTNNDGADEIAVGGVTSTGAVKIVIVSSAGRTVRTWTLRSSGGSGLVDLTAADLNGNGTEELLSLPRRGRGLVDVWSPTGRHAQTLTVRPAVTTYSLTHLD